jgi:hypothetical protein
MRLTKQALFVFMLGLPRGCVQHRKWRLGQIAFNSGPRDWCKATFGPLGDIAETGRSGGIAHRKNPCAKFGDIMVLP